MPTPYPSVSSPMYYIRISEVALVFTAMLYKKQSTLFEVDLRPIMDRIPSQMLKSEFLNPDCQVTSIDYQNGQRVIPSHTPQLKQIEVPPPA